MKQCVLIVIGVLGLSAVADAQSVVPSPVPQDVSLGWNLPTEPASTRTGFRVYDGGVLIVDNIDPTAVRIPFPALTPGLHSLTIRSFVLTSVPSTPVVEGIDSNILGIQLVVVPSSPTNLRIITAKLVKNIGWVPVLEVVRG